MLFYVMVFIVIGDDAGNSDLCGYYNNHGNMSTSGISQKYQYGFCKTVLVSKQCVKVMKMTRNCKLWYSARHDILAHN